MKKLGNILLYLVLGAIIGGFCFGALGALFDGEALAKPLGLGGLVVGALAGLAVGVERDFA